MCGLFGYYGSHNPDMSRLTGAALLAAKRGPDGWGIVTQMDEFKDLGRLKASVVRDLCRDRVVIGHCRLATVIGTKRKACCQPLRVGRFVVAHNGTIANADELAARFGFCLQTGVDSEIIPHLLDIQTGTTFERIASVLDMVDHGGHYALTVFDRDTMQVHLRASGIPLWRYVAQEGTYWCSIRPDSDWEHVYA